MRCAVVTRFTIVVSIFFVTDWWDMSLAKRHRMVREQPNETRNDFSIKLQRAARDADVGKYSILNLQQIRGRNVETIRTVDTYEPNINVQYSRTQYIKGQQEGCGQGWVPFLYVSAKWAQPYTSQQNKTNVCYLSSVYLTGSQRLATYEEAKELCDVIGPGAKLASIKDASENEFLRSYIQGAESYMFGGRKSIGLYVPHWIGIVTNDTNAATVSWEDGTTSSFVNFTSDKEVTGYSSGRCGAFASALSDNNKWTTLDCKNKLPYICLKDRRQDEKCAPVCDIETSYCTYTAKSYECACKPGYRAVNIAACENINECTEQESVCDFETNTCVDTNGGHVCRCKEGFTGSDSTNCQDINECNDGMVREECYQACLFGRCINLEGSYVCNCLGRVTESNDDLVPILLIVVEIIVILGLALTVYFQYERVRRLQRKAQVCLEQNKVKPFLTTQNQVRETMIMIESAPATINVPLAPPPTSPPAQKRLTATTGTQESPIQAHATTETIAEQEERRESTEKKRRSNTLDFLDTSNTLPSFQFRAKSTK